MTGVRIYDPSDAITYRHPGQTDGLSLAKYRHNLALRSVEIVNFRTMVREGRDPATNQRVRYMTASDRACVATYLLP